TARAVFANLSHVEIVDPHRVRIHGREPDPAFLLRFSTGVSHIVSRRGWMEAGGFDAWARKPVGTGPYQVARYASGDVLELAAFPGYWGGRPAFAEISMRQMPEVSSRVNAVLTGEAHIATDIPPDQFERFAGRPGQEIVGGPIMNVLLV